MSIDLLDLIARAQSLQPNTKRAYSNAVRQWLDFAGSTPADWTVAKGQAFYDHLIAGGVAARSANNLITGGLAFAFKRARALGTTVPAIVDGIDKVRITTDLGGGGEDNPRHALTTPQMHALLTACDGKRLIDLRDRAVFQLGMYTGMRRMSLVSLDLGFVKEYEGYVTLRALIKGGKWYWVPLDARAWAELQPYRDALHTHRPAAGALFPPIGNARLSAAASTGLEEVVQEGALTEDGLYHAVKGRAADAHVKFSPHVFRHTFSTWCRKAGIRDDLIEVVTAHRSQRGVVDRVYTDRTQLYQMVARDCYDAITARLRGKEA